MNLKETYNRIAEDWVKDHDKDTWGIPGAETFLSFLPRGSSVLDIGCGGGIKTNYIASQGYDATGIDLSEKMIEIAKRDYPQLEFSVLDMYDINQYPKTVDAIFVQAALLHIEKARVPEVLEKMKVRLNTGGLIYIAVKAKREDGVDEEVKTENDYGYEYQRFFSYYTNDELRAYLTSMNFDILWEGEANTGASKWLQVIGKKK